jgi:hypothetical protein
MEKNDLDYLSKRFGIPESEILWFNSGICYSRIQVRTRKSADKVRSVVKGNFVNGGMLDGMPLGGISVYKDSNGDIYYDITC